MNISGVLVHAYPADAEAVRDNLLKLPGVEVHGISEKGSLVVTVEEDDSRLMADTVMKFQDLPGVLSAAMIYHHCEEDDDTRQQPGKILNFQNVSNAESGPEEASR